MKAILQVCFTTFIINKMSRTVSMISFDTYKSVVVTMKGFWIYFLIRKKNFIRLSSRVGYENGGQNWS